MLIISMNV